MFKNAGGWKKGEPPNEATLNTFKAFQDPTVKRFLEGLSKPAGEPAGTGGPAVSVGHGVTRVGNPTTDSVVVFASSLAAAGVTAATPVLFVDSPELATNEQFLGDALSRGLLVLFGTGVASGSKIREAMSAWDVFVTATDWDKEKKPEPRQFAAASKKDVSVYMREYAKGSKGWPKSHPLFPPDESPGYGFLTGSLFVRSFLPFASTWPNYLTLDISEDYLAEAFAEMLHFVVTSLVPVKPVLVWYCREEWLHMEGLLSSFFRILAHVVTGHEHWTVVVVTSELSPEDMGATLNSALVDVTGSPMLHYPTSNAFIQKGYPLARATFTEKWGKGEKSAMTKHISQFWKSKYKVKMENALAKVEAGMKPEQPEFDEDVEDALDGLEGIEKGAAIQAEDSDAKSYHSGDEGEEGEESDGCISSYEFEDGEMGEEEEELEEPRVGSKRSARAVKGVRRKHRSPSKSPSKRPRVSSAAMPRSSQATSSTGEQASPSKARAGGKGAKGGRGTLGGRRRKL